jgi:selenocysteine-specific elongation factor
MPPRVPPRSAPLEIQPIVIGTAGHIDHGKSTLVRALTGVDPDRLKEEKERGLTIDLGFAPLELPDGRRVGIVDVPGHERFVRNMVAGASGIDLVVLVVAADDGVMPQTREHLQIMELLGVERGMVALTKVDAVDPELAELAAADVAELLEGTFLEDAPVLGVSAVTGDGLEAFKDELFRMAAESEPRAASGLFRMPVQRVFHVRGRGTVVTGIPVSGTASVGDTLEVLPGGGRGKVRGMQAYREDAESARAGHSTAINLSDVEHSAVRRGDVVATPNYFAPVRMVGARLTALPGLDRAIGDRIPIRLHTGTADAPGELVLLDAEELQPGGTGLVQLRLSEPVVCAPGDRFVLRLLSPVVTLGGGVILEESRHRLKRFKRFVLDELAHTEESLDDAAGLLESVLAREGEALATAEELARSIKRSTPETEQLLERLAGEGRAHRTGRTARWLHVDALEAALARTRGAVEGWFTEQPHRSWMDVAELRRLTGLEAPLDAALLEELEAREVLELAAGGRLRPAGREAAADPRTREVADAVLGKLEASPFQPPAPAELVGAAGASAGDVTRALELLEDEGKLERATAELVYAASAMERVREEVRSNCERHGHLEIPELRDALGTTRKFLIPLLEHLDAVGFTMRQGAHRVLKRR